MKKIISLICFSLITTPLLASPVADTSTPQTQTLQGRLRPLLQSLNLSKEQHHEIQILVMHHHEEKEAVDVELILSVKEKQFQLLTQENLNESELSDLIDVVHFHEKKALIHDMHFKNQLFNVLNEEQKLVISDRFAQLIAEVGLDLNQN